MKIKIPVKILTLILFGTLIIGLVLYKGGYVFSGRSIEVRGKIENPEIPVVGKEDVGFYTFRNLDTAGKFGPEYFDTVYRLTPHFSEIEKNSPDHFYLSSSKSTVGFIDLSRFDRIPGVSKSTFEIQMEKQLKSINSKK